VLICDTNAFATVLWHRRYMGHHSQAVAEIARRARCDLYFLTGDEIPFVQDGCETASTSEERCMAGLRIHSPHNQCPGTSSAARTRLECVKRFAGLNACSKIQRGRPL
jgi:hypothetical protein